MDDYDLTTFLFYLMETLNIMYRWLTRLLLFVIKLTNGIIFFAAFVMVTFIIGLLTMDIVQNDGTLIIYVINALIQNDFVGVFYLFYTFTSKIGINVTILLFVIAALLFALKYGLLRIFKQSLMYKKRIRVMIYTILKFVVNIGILCLLLVFYINIVFTGYLDKMIDTDIVQIGKSEYIKKLQLVEDQIKDIKQGAAIALNKIIYDILENPKILDELSDEQHYELCLHVNKLIDEKGGPFTAIEHYFRNVLNRAPSTLGEMIEAINAGADWELKTPEQNMFHMFGVDGEYNVKFLTGDGIFEAVYDKYGMLLTKEYGWENMGTYNYMSPEISAAKHGLYDVTPYFMWGNMEKGFSESESSEDNLKKFYDNPDAVNAYERLRNKLK